MCLLPGNPIQRHRSAYIIIRAALAVERLPQAGPPLAIRWLDKFSVRPRLTGMIGDQPTASRGTTWQHNRDHRIRCFRLRMASLPE
jgi:hypothetical protein